MKKILPLIIITLLSGCGAIDNAVRNDSSIQEKTAFALGTTAEKITIENRKGDLMAVRFNAKYAGRVYQCYYTSAGITSDVLCSPTDGKAMPTSQQCNALLKAAGRC
ncbi:hypothetical protein VII00023_22979 [Vibrio ichthyoenteri ATCC 700023]|uniref:Lipoprotein n=1 Tax=Vibrio ichthyoenteri ATCC 700023 TaxID=870968 RepID=F9S7K1_9VIBR|nr:hypothetical protein [Vibrio ichthyoenteri]EGU31297.1 hypothetical protein VII00023_22979 [Vibrio ichthyoenteri ATCC 700023]